MDDATRGLPPSAAQRVQRQSASGVSSSLFSAPAAAAAKSAGLAPVGEVFGCLVMNLGWTGSGCGWAGSFSSGINGWGGYAASGISMGGGFLDSPRSPVITSGQGGRYNGFSPYVQAFEAAWNGAIQRMEVEATALGADGVVGVRMERKLLDDRVWEFTALGTAVRSTDVGRTPGRASGTLWSTNLSTEDTASAVLSGYLPREIVLGLSVSTKHEDWQLRNQRASWNNVEVEGMTQLITAARNEARQRLHAHATRSAGAQVVVTEIGLHEFETECGGQEGRDYHAEATFVGTTLVPLPDFHRSDSVHVTTVLPLRM